MTVTESKKSRQKGKLSQAKRNEEMLEMLPLLFFPFS